MSEESEDVNDEIPIFEDEHEAFAASRSSQYVYVPARDHYFPVLDQHADTLEGDVRLPLVILGGEGSGKSALLSNWVAKRRINKHRDEFLFQHFVGCSSQSCQLSHTLFRLETALKDFFQLREMEVPDSEERLRWSLNRFLGAAAKKHSPARIVIIIDGVNRLKGEGAPDGALHWLPTELPPSVRFIVSSVEFERATSKSKDDVPQHRTAIELTRRQCPYYRMEPLSVNTRHNVINVFSSKYPGKLDLQEGQQFKIVTAPASAQPLFMRSLLQSLRLGMAMTYSSIDNLLESFLRCNTAFELIEKSLNLCSSAIFEGQAELLGKVFTVVYVSRNGLSEEEIWGLIRMVSQTEPDQKLAPKLYAILREFCMVVNGLHSFSHEIYREVVYEKFICSHESLINWHHLMARFFGQLPPCDRKLECLPYHLEVAGSWTRVKNCLTDIEMFRLWWTPKFKKEFIKLWASLTARPSTKSKEMDTEEIGTATGEMQGKARPVYDIVEEYAKSLDEYRDIREPKDEEVAETILQIGDFLIEFATLGLELPADVPATIHPSVPSDDLCSLGVPHITEDEEGRSVLVMPSWAPPDDGKKAILDAPTKPNEDLPECTTYFYHRWMWIQFPYIALGNCGQRYFEGIKVRQSLADGSAGGKTKKSGMDSMSSFDRPNTTTARDKIAGRRSMSANALSFSLPELKFNRKAARTMRRVVGDDVNDPAVISDKIARRLMSLQDEIQSLREEHDFMSGQKSVLSKRLDQIKLTYKEIKVVAGAGEQYDKELEEVAMKEDDTNKKLSRIKIINRNLQSVILMCERHPPENTAIITDAEHKLKQDRFLIREIKARLYEQKFEKQSHVASFRKMKNLVQQGVHMHTKLLEYRYGMKRYLQNQTAEDSRVIQARSMKHSSIKGSSHSSVKLAIEGEVAERSEYESRADHWQHVWHVIGQRTGITDPDIFFQRLNNGGHLEEQMNTLKRVSENRLNALKSESADTEVELEEVRYEASFAGGQSRDAYQKQKELSAVQQRIRRLKERSESAEQLQQRVTAGLNHICELLGIPLRGEEASVVDIFHDIDSVLETLVEERDKGSNTSETPGGFARAALARESSASPDSHRQIDLENMLAKLELPKTRVAAKLPSRSVDIVLPSGRESEDEEIDDEGMWDRKYAKTQSQKSVRAEQKKAARQYRHEILSSTM
eukprot:gene7718-15792_t